MIFSYTAFSAVAASVLVATLPVVAQRLDCPVRDAPMPTRPPGKPAGFAPQVTFPEKFGDEVKVETGVVLPARAS